MAGSEEPERRARSMNARFVAYLEKHRIYEIFHEIATQLLVKRPDDPVEFMKQYLDIAAKRLDVPRIILLAPPTFDKMALANVLTDELGVYPVTLKDLREASTLEEHACRCAESEDLALAMKRILESGTLYECGWLLVDLPRTKEEARIFQRLGIMPTHVIQLIVPTEIGICPKEIEVGIRSMDELGKDCAKLAKLKKHTGAPSLFRIVLIGSRGSGCKTLAKYLAERFNLVHIDYDYIAKQARLQQNPLGEMLRLFEQKWGERPKPEIRIQIIERQISKNDCLKKGWVLTGYPKNVEDFKLLDLCPTPPNRVIFVEVNSDISRDRLLSRRINMETGSVHHVPTRNYVDTDVCQLAVHPKDYRLNVERDLQEFEENITEMMKYAGESAIKIDGNEDEKTVREKVEACLMRPAPSSLSRIPKPPPEIDPMDIEFDPDDEPLHIVCCNTIPTYTFV